MEGDQESRRGRRVLSGGNCYICRASKDSPGRQILPDLGVTADLGVTSVRGGF